MRGSDRADLRDRIEYQALRLLLVALGSGGPARSRRAGLALGSFAARCVPLRREVALENLRRAFPERDEVARRKLYRDMVRNLGVVLSDVARMAHRPREETLRTIALEHPEVFDEVLRAGKGGLLLSAHFGNWELFGAAARALGHPLTVLGARQRNPLVESLFSKIRGRFDIEAITVRGGLTPLVRALRRGRLVATLADQDGGPEGFFMEFLGRPASVQAGIFRLAARLGVPLVPGFSYREADGWRGIVQAPVFPRTAGDPDGIEAEARRLAAIYTARVEAEVRRRPDHWFWVHRRWRSRPGGNPQPSAAAGR